MEPEWVNDIKKVLDKNKFITIKGIIFILISYGIFVYLIFKKYTTQGMIVLILGIILGVFYIIFKQIKLSFSDNLAYDLFNVYINLEKFNGKNEIFKEGGLNHLTELDINISRYLQEKKRNLQFDFNYDKISLNLKKLRLSNKKTVSYFKKFDEYKNNKSDLVNIYRDIGNYFHENEGFPEKSIELINRLYSLDITAEKSEFNLSKYLKTYLWENKLLAYIFILIFLFVGVWYLPIYTNIIISEENRLIIIIPTAFIIITQIFLSTRKTEKKK